ncbi:MAG TPA: hypothetical protein DEH78_14820 [Solibacterales bacterium]|nr:hypothetical protein [Bryobacterales bacterium]
MTAAYTHPNWNKPDGSDTGPNVPLRARENLRVLRDGLLTGKVKDWTFLRTNGTGTADEPQYWIFKNTVNNIWFRFTNTWTASKITSQLVEWSDDGGATWATVQVADAIVYDGNLNITSQSIASGVYVFILELIAKGKLVAASLVAHIAGTGTGVHGLGTMSTQASTAVNIDGGTIDGTAIGGAAPSSGSFTRVVEALNALAPGLNAGVTVDWAYGGTRITNNGNNNVTFANIPGGIAGHLVYVSNHNATLWPASVTWGVGGKPSINGAATIILTTDDTGTNVRASVGWRAV